MEVLSAGATVVSANSGDCALLRLCYLARVNVVTFESLLHVIAIHLAGHFVKGAERKRHFLLLLLLLLLVKDGFIFFRFFLPFPTIFQLSHM